MVPFLPSLQTEYTVRRVAGAEHGEKEPSLSLSTHRLSAEIFRANACGGMASAEYCYSGFESRILQKPADDKPSGNWKEKGANQLYCADVNGALVLLSQNSLTARGNCFALTRRHRNLSARGIYNSAENQQSMEI